MKMKLGRVLAIAALLAACADLSLVTAQTPGASTSLFAATPSARAQLPNRLNEISGLAVSADGRLFAHDDERAVIYQLDPADGAIVKSFMLGETPQSGDFEGLAIDGAGAFWLTTSHGRLYRFNEGADGAHVAFETFESGLRDVCEIEGLAYAATAQALILACKQNKRRGTRGTISLYRWGFTGAAEPWLELREADIAARSGVQDFRPSSIEIDAASGRILLLSADDGAFAEISADGAIIAARSLGAGHPQPEGATVLPDGSLVISDEASGGRAQISRYARRP